MQRVRRRGHRIALSLNNLVFEFVIGAATPVILASFLKGLFNLKKVVHEQIFLGPPQHRAVSCVLSDGW